MTEASHALAVASSMAYGAADFLGGLATKRGSTVFSVVVFSQSVGLVLVLLSLPFLPPASPAAADLVWGAAAGLAGGVVIALLYRGLAIGMMSLVAPVTAVCAVIVPLIVGLARGERPSGPAATGVLLAILAIVLISQTGQREDGTRATTGLWIAVASGVVIGLFLVCLERTAPSAGLWPLAAARGASVSLFTAAGLISREKLVPRRESAPIVLGGGALDMTANVLYLLAVHQGPLSIVATLTSLYPASTILLARIVLRERLRLVQGIGVACAAAAIVLIVSG
jgi:drug/metabolite transporter (DMT)-like permease